MIDHRRSVRAGFVLQRAFSWRQGYADRRHDISEATTVAPDRDRPRLTSLAQSSREERASRHVGGVHRRIDAGLTLLLAVQAVTIFIVIPLSVHHVGGRILLNLSQLAFTVTCIKVLVRHRAVQFTLIAALAVLVVGPIIEERLALALSVTPSSLFEVIAAAAFVSNATVTSMVARHVFGPGRVTSHRIQGAILIYLNVASLCLVAFIALTNVDPQAIVPSTGGYLPGEIRARVAALTYFSLTTITTTGFGDLVPLHPIARSIANLEAVFGHLFPATLLARLVALHVAHNRDGEEAADP